MNSYKLILLPSLLILITSCGGGGGSSSDSSAPNTAPELTGTTEFAIDENTTDVSTFQANDAQNDSITYYVEGTDSSFFSIGESSGVLVFKIAPDYEDPQDGNYDNTYELSVGASDGSLSSTLGITVSVNDVNENPSASISVDNDSIKTYSQITISWECTNSTSAIAEGSWSGSKSLSGSEKIYLSSSGTKTFTIKCVYDGGETSESVSVSVGDISLKNVPSNVSLFKDE